MAMQSGVVVVPEKIPVQWYSQQQQPPLHQMDEREGFLMWLRGEFAAANAIIDALCHHLRAVGEPGEYDGVIGSVQQRRCNWNPILHMQQYFPVADVVYALQLVGWKRQQKVAGFDGVARMRGGGKEFRRGGRGQRGGLEVHNLGGEMNGKDLNSGFLKSNFDVNEKLDGEDKARVEKKEENEETSEKFEENNTATRQRSTQEAVAHADVEADDTGSCSVDGNGFVEKSNLEITPKTFVATEMCDGKPVNIAEGLKLYEDLFDDSEILKLNNLVSDLRAAGKRGQLQGQTFVISKRPMKGHGREMIQLGIPVADPPPEDDEAVVGVSKDPKTEPIPVLLQDAIERLLTEHIVSVKPDSAFIDVFNEGDHSNPHIWPHCLGRPVCVIFLTACEMSFGKVIAMDQPGHYRGALKLSLSPGSMIVMQGRSADFARHAINSMQKQRILLTLVKSQPKGHRFQAPSCNWSPPPMRSASHNRPGAAKHFAPATPTGVLSARQQLPPPNGIQPMFVATPVTPGMAFSAPVAIPASSVGWPSGPPRPASGTGVFFPSQGSGNGNVTSNGGGTSLPKGDDNDDDDGGDDQECNGSGEKAVSLKEEEEEVGNSGG